MAAKERSSFTLSSEVKKNLEAAVPKSCRSQFIEQAIQQALKNKTKQELFALIDAIEPLKSELNSVELVSAIREERLNRLTTVINE